MLSGCDNDMIMISVTSCSFVSIKPYLGVHLRNIQFTGFIGDFPTSPLVNMGDDPLAACGNGGGGGGGGGMLFEGGDCDMTGGGGGKSTGGVADTGASTGGGGGGGNVSLPLLMLLPRVGVLADGVL